MTETGRFLTTFKFERGRRKPWRGFKYCTYTTMVIPTEYITLSGTDKTTEGKYKKKNETSE